MKISSIFNRNKRSVRDADSQRRRREGILIIVIILVVVLLTFVETRTIRFGDDIPVSNAILMFILININLLLLILLTKKIADLSLKYPIAFPSSCKCYITAKQISRVRLNFSQSFFSLFS